MERLHLGPMTGKGRGAISNPAKAGQAKVTITTRSGIGTVWALLPTDKPTFRFNRLELKPNDRTGDIATYWVKTGIYMLDFWDGGRTHRNYIKVNEVGDVVAIYSVTLGPSHAQAWIREQFPKPDADKAGR
jgi:hypothetical protein